MGRHRMMVEDKDLDSYRGPENQMGQQLRDCVPPLENLIKHRS